MRLYHSNSYFVNNPQKRGMVKTTSNDIESQLESDEDESNVEIKYVPSEEIYGAFCDEDWAVIGRSSRAFIVLWCFSQDSKHFLMS